MIGKVIKYGEENINTDLIIPARYLTKSDPDYLATHCMEDLDPNFNRKLEDNAYSILVAGPNFGCGSSREQAPIALKAAGIQCIIATSFARIFFRNAINIGLPIIELNKIDSIETDNMLEINLEEGYIHNISSSEKIPIKKIPSFLQEIIKEKGLVNFARNTLID